MRYVPELCTCAKFFFSQESKCLHLWMKKHQAFWYNVFIAKELKLSSSSSHDKDSLYAINNTSIKINTTTVNVFVSSVNRTCSVALLIDSSDRQNKHDVPFNGDRVATALATHWIHAVWGEVFKLVGANGRRYLTKERTGAQKQQQR